MGGLIKITKRKLIINKNLWLGDKVARLLWAGPHESFCHRVDGIIIIAGTMLVRIEVTNIKMSTIDRDTKSFLEKVLGDMPQLLHITDATKLLEGDFEIFHEININGRLYMALEVKKSVAKNFAGAEGDSASKENGWEAYKGVAGIEPCVGRKTRSKKWKNL